MQSMATSVDIHGLSTDLLNSPMACDLQRYTKIHFTLYSVYQVGVGVPNSCLLSQKLHLPVDSAGMELSFAFMLRRHMRLLRHATGQTEQASMLSLVRLEDAARCKENGDGGRSRIHRWETVSVPRSMMVLCTIRTCSTARGTVSSSVVSGFCGVVECSLRLLR